MEKRIKLSTHSWNVMAATKINAIMQYSIIFVVSISLILILDSYISIGLGNTITLTGRGTTATNLFHLDEGLYTFNLKLSTTSTYESFYIYLHDSYGNKVKTLCITSLDHPGSTQISKAVRIDYSDNYLLDIDTDGDWEISIISGSEIPIIDLSDTGFCLSGTGTTATNLFHLDEGLFVFNMKLSTTAGSESFYIWGSV